MLRRCSRSNGFVARPMRGSATPGVTTWLDLGTAPIHGAPSSRMLVVADMTEIAPVLDRRSGLKLAGLRELPAQCPNAHDNQ
jgi:hypothetical protein